jgi:hydrogenase maturation protease
MIAGAAPVEGSARRDLGLLVLGLGNLICQDDGVGPLVVERLAAVWEPAAGAELADGGTLGLSLMPLVERAERLLIVDAVAADAPPGTLVRLEGEEVGPAVTHRLSPHQIGVADLLNGLLLVGRLPSRVALLGLVPASLGVGVGVTDEVAAGVPALERAVLAEASAMGFPFEAKRTDATPSPAGRAGAAAAGRL